MSFCQSTENILKKVVERERLRAKLNVCCDDKLLFNGCENVYLTKREMEVLQLVVLGKSNTQIAKELIISPHTAKAHVCSILQKLNVKDRVQAAVKAVQQNLIPFHLS